MKEHCDVCGKLTSEAKGYLAVAPGSTRVSDGAWLCVDCTTAAEIEGMIKSGHAWMYLEQARGGKPTFVANWHGTKRFPVRDYSIGSHNWRGVEQIYVRFVGPDGARWWGRHVSGGMNMYVHVHRCKGGAKAAA